MMSTPIFVSQEDVPVKTGIESKSSYYIFHLHMHCIVHIYIYIHTDSLNPNIIYFAECTKYKLSIGYISYI